jgi:hypothetical protein
LLVTVDPAVFVSSSSEPRAEYPLRLQNDTGATTLATDVVMMLVMGELSTLVPLRLCEGVKRQVVFAAREGEIFIINKTNAQ